MTDLTKELWGIFLAAVAAVVWLIRLEGKVALNSAAIRRLEQQRHDDMVAAREARGMTNDGLRDIRGDLSEIRADIKSLMRSADN